MRCFVSACSVAVLLASGCGDAFAGCPDGYEGDPCVWSGGFRDPELTDPSAWSASSSEVAILPDATGLGPGLASFAPSVVCNAGSLAQIVQMPPSEVADPFVLEITYRADEVNGVDVYYGRAFRTLPVTFGRWATERFCLGEAAYGGPVTFEVLASERFQDCFGSPMGTIDVDRLEILVAEPGECPPANAVSNGSAELDGGGWSFELDVLRLGEAAASLEAGVGKDGTSGARLYKAAGSQKLAGMRTQVSVPLPSSLPSPALRFWWKASGWTYQVQIGAYPGLRTILYPLGTLLPSEGAQVNTYCLPPWTHGNVVDLSFILKGGFFADEAELVVDQVELLSDPKCGDSPDILDPDFEAAPNEWPGVIETRVSDPVVKLVRDPDRAGPSGDGFLEFSYSDNQLLVDANTWVWIPRSEGDRGPQLRYYSNVPVDPGVAVETFVGRSFVGQPVNTLETGGGWRPHAECLPPQWADRWFRFRVSIGSAVPPEEVVVFDGPKRVLIDDIQLRLDGSCPTGAPQ
jgi:hypothetical protein